MSAVTPDGFQCDDLATIFAGLQAAMRMIVGQDINLDADTIDGQTLGIFAEAKADSDQLAQDVYNNWNPQTATGVALSRIVQFNGIRRIAAQPSQGTITCGGTVRTHIPIGSIVESEATSERFVTIQDAIIEDTGEVEIAILSQNYGAIQAPAGTITRIITPVFGWQTVSNIHSVILGRNMETDEELRIRRAQSVSTPAQSIHEAVYGAIKNIPRVIQARLYENYMPVEDTITGLPPHSFCMVVHGGDDYDIAWAIWTRASIGATQVGNRDITIRDIQGYPHVITFMRPLLVRIYIAIGVRALRGWNEALFAEIKRNLVQWTLENWTIGDELIYSRLYEPINELPPVFSITSLAMDTISPPVRMGDIPMPFGTLAVLDAADISVFYEDYTNPPPILPPGPPPLLPTITNISPVTGVITGGTAVTITGANYAPGEEVRFGDVLATAIDVIDANTITCLTPPNFAGAVSVTVSLAGQSITLNDAFTYFPPSMEPQIFSITPAYGPWKGGQAVMIRGENFNPEIGAVNFTSVTSYTGPGGTLRPAAQATNVVLVNSTTITCRTGSAQHFISYDANHNGVTNVSVVTGRSGVVTPGKQSVLANGYKYVSGPIFVSKTPSTGPTAGGTPVTITGQNFYPANPSVTFGGIPATNVTVVNETTITCISPPRSPAGTVMLEIRIADVAQPYNASAYFTYQ